MTIVSELNKNKLNRFYTGLLKDAEKEFNEFHRSEPFERYELEKCIICEKLGAVRGMLDVMHKELKMIGVDDYNKYQNKINSMLAVLVGCECVQSHR